MSAGLSHGVANESRSVSHIEIDSDLSRKCVLIVYFYFKGENVHESNFRFFAFFGQIYES